MVLCFLGGQWTTDASSLKQTISHLLMEDRTVTDSQLPELEECDSLSTYTKLCRLTGNLLVSLTQHICEYTTPVLALIVD